MAKGEDRAARDELCLRNRQRTRSVNLKVLEAIARDLLTRQFSHPRFALGIHLVAAPEMTRLNEQFLRHAGSTDVISFDYTDREAQAFPPVAPGDRTRAPCRRAASPALWGEIFICLDDAVAQARRFRTTWQSEVARYLIHGLLHLHGYDDRRPAARLTMKREENRLLRDVSRRFTLRSLGQKSRGSWNMLQSALPV